MRPIHLRLHLLSALALLTLSRAQDLFYIDARTNFSSSHLSRACAAPVVGAWSQCVAGGGGPTSYPAALRPGRAYVVPPLPRYAVLNPMHALVDHVWAFAAQFSACAGPAVNTIVLMGVRRRQIERFEISKDLTVALNLDMDHMLPTKKQPDSMDHEPTWGQWLMYVWAKGSVGAENIIFEDDVRRMGREGVCFEDGVLTAGADFFGVANRAMRLEFKPEGGDVQAIPWGDFPERWKRRGVQELRRVVAKELGLDMAPRVREGDSNIRVLLTTRRKDSRRRWQNSEQAVAALVKEFGDTTDVRVIDELKGMSFQDQAEAYNWADVLVGIHGASMANAMFMRDGSGVVEVWRCCYDILAGNEKSVRPWTGWLLGRMSMTLTYIGCTEVTDTGDVLPLSKEDLAKGVDGICAMSDHMNALNVAVDASSLPEAVRRSNSEAKKAFGQKPLPVFDLLPANWHGKVEYETRPKVIDRRYAPVGPGWSEGAIGSEGDVKRQERFEAYLKRQSQKMGEFWRKNALLSDSGADPLTLDSVVEVYDEVQEEFAWHAGLVPEDTVSLDVHLPGQRRPENATSTELSARDSMPRVPGSNDADTSTSTDAMAPRAVENGKVPPGRRLEHDEGFPLIVSDRRNFQNSSRPLNITDRIRGARIFGSSHQWRGRWSSWASLSQRFWFLYLFLIVAACVCITHITPCSAACKSARKLSFAARARGARQRLAPDHVSAC